MDYAMYTRVGNDLVDEVVKTARANRWTWKETYNALVELSRKHKRAAEATDTAVRECVYHALGFTDNFYV